MSTFDEERFDWVEHLEELRRRLFVILGVILLATGVSYFFSDQIYRLLTLPLAARQEKLYFMQPYEAFLVKLTLALFSGVVLSSPAILLQLWCFVAPGLYEKEKRVVISIVGATLICFLVGVSFALFFVAPFALEFFLGFQTSSLKPLLSVKEYVSFLTSFLLAFGVAFIFPVFLIGLVKLGVLSAQTIAKQRRIAIVLILILAAILTPSTDVISQVLLAIPLVFLFEISVFIARRLEEQ